MQFRKFFWSTIIGTIVSGVMGVVLAYYGYGIWALVAQYCVQAASTTVVLWIVVRWRPQIKFSIKRFKALYSYGWKIFAASMIKVLYNDLRSIVIGKAYSPADLAYYNKGQSFPQLIESNVGGTIDSVLFPAFSKKQDSKAEMLSILRRAIKTSTYVLMPLLAGLAAVAAPLVEILLTSKWLECVPYMQIICFTFMFMPIEIDNLQAIKAMGRSDLVMMLEIIKKVVGVALLVFSIPFGIKAIAFSMLVGAIINAIIDAVPNRKLLGYKFSQQFIDILPSLLLSLLMFGGVYALSFIPINIYLLFTIQFAAGVTFYAGVSAILRVESFMYLLSVLKSMFAKKKNA
ncbi:MAG: oligosaccharide flippase family protein, partial [Clostridia bacterium]|nr:oligosaccharide flippase family protein [Clostridia bacterium]